MAYYVRPDSSAGRYIRTDVPEGHYFAHSAEGTTWAKGHKYIDKRLINGVWKYLYEVPKAYVTEGRDSAKAKASEAKKDVSKGAKATKENVTKAAKDFKDYSKNVDNSKKLAEEAARKNLQREQKAKAEEKRAQDVGKQAQKDYEKAFKEDRERRNQQQAGVDKAKADDDKARDDFEKTRLAYEKALHEFDTVKETYPKNSEAYKYAEEAKDEAWNDYYEIAKNDALEARKKYEGYKDIMERDNKKAGEKYNEITSKAEQAGKDYRAASEEREKASEEREKAEREYEEAAREQETAMYKASKALNDIIDGTTGATKQAAQWLKNQLNSGADWTTDQIEKIRESDAVASLAGKLENLYANANSGATKKGLSILSQIIGWGKLEAPKKSSGSSSSGRTYSGTGTKAQRREAVDGGPVSNNDYSNRPKKRR